MRANEGRVDVGEPLKRTAGSRDGETLAAARIGWALASVIDLL
jgi:hypothetical protein